MSEKIDWSQPIVSLNGLTIERNRSGAITSIKSNNSLREQVGIDSNPLVQADPLAVKKPPSANKFTDPLTQRDKLRFPIVDKITGEVFANSQGFAETPGGAGVLKVIAPVGVVGSVRVDAPFKNGTFSGQPTFILSAKPGEGVVVKASVRNSTLVAAGVDLTIGKPGDVQTTFSVTATNPNSKNTLGVLDVVVSDPKQDLAVAAQVAVNLKTGETSVGGGFTFRF